VDNIDGEDFNIVENHIQVSKSESKKNSSMKMKEDDSQTSTSNNSSKRITEMFDKNILTSQKTE